MKPYKNYVKTPDSHQCIYDTIEFVTGDSLTLFGWYIHSKIPDSRKPSIILSYGDAGNMSYFLDYADEFSKNGNNVFLINRSSRQQEGYSGCNCGGALRQNE